MGVMKLHGLFLLIYLSKFTTAFRVFEHSGVETILALENENVAIQCKTDLPIFYCGFIHPNGTRYSSTKNNGNCVVTIKATRADVGEWKCHIGMQTVRVEMMKRIELRVVGRIAAVQANVTAMHGKSVTLACATTQALLPISYCRFEPPNASPFSIDSTVNASFPILKKYYFPPNRSLDRGDCAVTIRRVSYEDLGDWICGAGLEDGKEHIDRITLEVEGLYTMSTASVTGVTLGSILIAAVLVTLGYVAWKRRWIMGTRRQDREVIEIQELGQQQAPASASRDSPPTRRQIPTVQVQPPTPVTPLSSP